MTSVTQKIRRFTGGISDQPDEQKLPGQVRDAVNCTPDVVYGLLKRPGTNTIEWSNGAPSADGKWFWINKRNPATGPEKYVGQIDNETGKVRVWDLVTGTEQNVCYTSTIDLTSDFRGMTGTKNHPQDVCTLPGEGTDPAAANEPYSQLLCFQVQWQHHLYVGQVQRKGPIDEQSNLFHKHYPKRVI